MEEANYIITAITTVLAIFAFVTALFLFVAQTENYNRVSHFWMQKGNRAWLVLFNSSRRHLINWAFHKPLSIDASVMTYLKVNPVGEVILALGVYWFICQNRPIFVKEYWGARKKMKGEGKDEDVQSIRDYAGNNGQLQ